MKMKKKKIICYLCGKELKEFIAYVDPKTTLCDDCFDQPTEKEYQQDRAERTYE